MIRLAFFNLLILLTFSCSDNSSTETEDIFFDPIILVNHSLDNNLINEVKNLTLSQTAKGIVLNFSIEKRYTSEDFKYGIRIFRRVNPKKTTSSYLWDFSGAISEDWSTELVFLKASDINVCLKSGNCNFLDENIFTSSYITYALMVYSDYEDNLSDRSLDKTIDTQTAQTLSLLDFSEGFMENQTPGQLANLYGFKKDSDWFWLNNSIKRGDQSSLINNSIPLTLLKSKDLKYLSIADSDNNRVFLYSKYPNANLNYCVENFNNNDDINICENQIRNNGFAPALLTLLGQKDLNTKDSFSANTMDTSRKFQNSISSSIQKSSSGKIYTFVADEARILIREDSKLIGSSLGDCSEDEGSSVNETDYSYGYKGFCGFTHSIGSYSPLHRCLYKNNTTTKIIASETCTDDDLKHSLKDEVAPSNISLRKPSTPLIVGNDLYIPDSGNARILKIKNFEEKLTTCGRLLAPGEETLKEASLTLSGLLTGVQTPAINFNYLKKGIEGNNVKIQLFFNQASTKITIIGDPDTVSNNNLLFINISTTLASLSANDLSILFNNVNNYVDSGGNFNIIIGNKILSLISTTVLNSAVVITNNALNSLTGGAEAKNKFCEFDQVIGSQGFSRNDSNRFNLRSCIRGGETTGINNSFALDPLNLGQIVGESCRLNTVEITPGQKSTEEKQVKALNYSDNINTQLSSNGVLSVETKRMFRYPLKIMKDNNGYLYVLDVGRTKMIDSSGSGTASTLLGRVMVWRNDPFSLKECLSGADCTFNSTTNICTGSGCTDKQCYGDECNADIFFGQDSDVKISSHKASEEVGVNYLPNNSIYLNDFDIVNSDENANMSGLWATSAYDKRIFHWKIIDQFATPVIHYTKKDSDNDSLDILKNGNFNAIMADPYQQLFYLTDSKRKIIYIYQGQ